MHFVDPGDGEYVPAGHCSQYWRFLHCYINNNIKYGFF